MAQVLRDTEMAGLTMFQDSNSEAMPSRRYSTVAEIESPVPSPIDIRLVSRHFEDYFDWEHVHPHTQRQGPILADTTFVGRLNEFTTTMESQVLYAHGRFQSQRADILRQSAAAYSSLALDAGVPVISYFCELSHDDPPPGRTRETMELTALLYAMVRQVINISPATSVGTTPTVTEAKLSALDRTLRTWKDAISLFEELVTSVQLPLLLFTIYGLNILEDAVERTTTGPLEDLVGCLDRLARADSAGEGTVVKILFTSSGLSEALFHFVDEESIIACDSSPLGAPNRPRRSRQVITYTND